MKIFSHYPNSLVNHVSPQAIRDQIDL
ncbi:hypothetical protein BRAS3809_6630001 [Bradyrhizobium sp. STM 3809]|nr:hypothetical protein BRAS3809_6630001 [Bradyrhizobium sp. STM 3809]